MNNEQLQYYLHDDLDAFRFELAGSLSGEGVKSLYHAWRTARSIIGNREMIVDITFVAAADEPGRELLRLWHSNGASIVARSQESNALAADILHEAIPERVPSRKPSWLRRVAAACAGLLAQADTSAGRGRNNERRNTSFPALAASNSLESRVP